MEFIRRGFYCILLLSQFETLSVFAQPVAKCVYLFAGDEILSTNVSGEVRMAWRELLNLDVRERLPDPEVVLSLSKRLSVEMARELDRQGFRTRLFVLPREVFPNFNDLIKPARWAVEILPDSVRDQQKLLIGKMGRQKLIIQNALKKHESRIYFDFLGLWLSQSSGAADYDGKTNMGFGKSLFEILDSDFVAVLLHEIHHAFNHKRLKQGKRGGLNAEVNVFPESDKIFKINGYPKHFHFDEIIANFRQFKQLESRLRELRAKGKLTEAERKVLEAERDNHLQTLLDQTQHARILTKLALHFMSTDVGRDLWEKKIIWYLPDTYHQSFSVNIPLILSSQPDLQQFKFTIWLPGAESDNGNRTEQNKNLILEALRELYEDVVYYRHQALQLKREKF